MSWLKNLYPNQNFGLLLLRLGIGIMFILHGWPKITGGPEFWAKVGGAMGALGITFGAPIWGFMAAFSETVGGLLLILGLFFRPATLLLFFTMVIASIMHLSSGDGFNGASHAIESGILFFSLLLIGPGKYSLDQKIFGDKLRRY